MSTLVSGGGVGFSFGLLSWPVRLGTAAGRFSYFERMSAFVEPVFWKSVDVNQRLEQVSRRCKFD